jgi:SAM-dependent methyltransferase
VNQSAFRELITRLSLSAGALTVLGAAIDAKVTGNPLEPDIQPHVDAVLDALGARDAITELGAPELRAALAEIRLTFLQGVKLLYEATRRSGWTYTDPDILMAAGETSAGFVGALKQTIAPRLQGLVARLETSGSFLDIGIGVAGLSIAMARTWLALRIVGVDVWGPSVALARENVRAAAMEDRIEVRQQSAEDLSDVNAFDLAWIPIAFVPAAALPASLRRVHRALRSGGWLLLGMVNPGVDPLAGSLARLRTALWGGALLVPTDVETMLRQAGYVDVQLMPAPPGAVAAMIAARRP